MLLKDTERIYEKNIFIESFITTHIFTIPNTFYFFLHFHVTSDVISFRSAWHPFLTFWGRFANNEFSLCLSGNVCILPLGFCKIVLLLLDIEFLLDSFFFFSFWYSEYVIPLPLGFHCFRKESGINHIDVPLYVINHFSLAGLEIFSLSFKQLTMMFKHLTMMYLCVSLLILILFWAQWASWLCVDQCFSSIQKVLSHYFSKILSFLLFFWKAHQMCIGVLSVIQISEVLLLLL